MRRLFLGIICSIFLANSSSGQASRVVDAQRGAEQSVNEGRELAASSVTQFPESVRDAGEAPATPTDDGLGRQSILFRRDNWSPWNLRFQLGGYAASNVALSSADEQDDSFLKTGLELSYTPKISGNLFGSLSAGYQNFTYSEFDALDFDLYDFKAGLLYATPKGATGRLSLWDVIKADVNLYARYEYYRITDTFSWGDTSFEDHSIVAGAQKNFWFSRGLRAFTGVMGDFSVDASRPEPQRHEYSFYAGAMFLPTPKLDFSVAYRVGYYDYFEAELTRAVVDTRTGLPVRDAQTGRVLIDNLGNRADWNHSFTLTIGYKLNDRAKLYASSTAVLNESNVEFFDYENFNLGASLGLSISW